MGSTGFDSFKAFTVEYATEASADQDLGIYNLEFIQEFTTLYENILKFIVTET